MSGKSKTVEVKNNDMGNGNGKKQVPAIYQLRISLAYGGKIVFNMAKKDDILVPSSKADNTKPKKKFRVKQKNRTEKRDKVPPREAMQILCSFPRYTGNPGSAAKLLLLVFLSQVLHLIAEFLPSNPIFLLKISSQTAKGMIGPLFTAIQGQEKWSGKGWHLERPWIIHPKLSSWETRPSSSMMNYIGGRFKLSKKKWREFYFPFVSSSMILLPGLPAEVSKQIVALSPLSMPILLQPMKLDAARPVIELEAQSFDAYDDAGIKTLESSAESCHALVVSFLSWFCEDNDNVDCLMKDMSHFRPVVRSGRFIQEKTDDCTEFLCIALAFFHQFLQFVSEIKGWIIQEEAREILLWYWRTVLPESAPPEENKAQGATPIAYETAEAFYQFLTERFLPTFHNQILHDKVGTEGAMGLIRELDGTNYFIMPRRRFLEAYAEWLKDRRAVTFDLCLKNGEATVQRKWVEAGVPLKCEANNPATWRYSFFGKDQGKVNCLALPISQLPEAVRTVFGQLFGTVSGNGTIPTRAEAVPNSQEEAKTL